MIDSNCKPWLIEVNSSPSLSTTTTVDKELKSNLLNDVYQIVVPEDWNEDPSKSGANTCTKTQVGYLQLLYDESSDNNKNIKKN